MTQYEIAEALGISRGTVQGYMRRLGITAVRNAQRPGNRRKEVVTYRQQHRRVEAARGKASGCEWCGLSDERRYHWANVTGNYDDARDFVSLCPSCHKTYDNQREA